MRTAFINTLLRLAEADERIWLLCGDLGYSVLEPFAHRFPERYTNVGVAEQNMTGIAAGLASCGKVVFTYSIANFPTLRCLEQIRNDVCYHNANVKIVAVGGGLAYGAQGYTHHGIEDFAIMRPLPNVVVMAPGDPIEAALATEAAATWPGPCYLRLGKSGEPVVHQTPPAFSIGKAIVVQDGTDLTLVTTGSMLSTVDLVGKRLRTLGIQARVISLPTIKPLDTQALCCAARETGCLVTIEEHTLTGGLGSAVAEALFDGGVIGVSLLRLGIREVTWETVGSQEYLRRRHALDTESLVERIKNLHSDRRASCLASRS